MNSTIEGFPQYIVVSGIATMSYSLSVVLPANAYVLWLILQEARLAPDIFCFNLSSGEILLSLFTVLNFIGCWYKCTTCFEAYLSVLGLFLTARPLFQCLICVECYLGVNHPVWFLRLKPLRYRLTCCALSWMMVICSCFYYKYTYRKLRHLFIFFIQNLLILFTVIFCLVSVLRTLRRPGPGKNNVQKKSSRTKMRAFKIILVAMASMTVNFLLGTIPIPLQLWLSESEFYMAYTFCNCLSFVTGCMQPLIYLQRSEKILCLRLN